MDEVRLFKRRVKAFFQRAKDSLNSGDYDLACFLSEQAVQLCLKSILLEEVGDYPKTHSFSALASLIEKIPSRKSLAEFIKRNLTKFSFLEDAYLLSRYFFREYSKEEAEEAINLAEEVLRLGKLL